MNAFFWVLPCLLNASSFYLEEKYETIGNKIYSVIRSDDARKWTIVEKEVSGAASKVIYAATHCIRDLSWSFDRSYLAFQVAGDPINSTSVEDVGHKLLILDKNYAFRAEIPNVRYYVWNYKANQLAAIVGGHLEEGVEYDCDEIILYKVDSQERISIPAVGYDIAWTHFDDNIYIETFNHNCPVLAYNPIKKTVNQTAYLGIYFSPDGSYYFTVDKEGGGYFSVRHRWNNQIVETNPLFKKEGMNALGWIENVNCIMVEDWPSKEILVINADTGKQKKLEIKTIQFSKTYFPTSILGDRAQEILNSLE